MIAISGFELRVEPVAPFIASREGGALSLRTRSSGRVTVVPGAKLSPLDRRALGAIARLEPGPRDARWRIALGGLVLPWPDGWELGSPVDDDSLPFELYGPRESVIFPRGPYPPEAIPGPGELVCDGQQVVADGPDAEFPWIEVEYDHCSMRWWQRHARARFDDGSALLVTAQALAPMADAVRPVLNEVIQGIARRR